MATLDEQRPGVGASTVGPPPGRPKSPRLRVLAAGLTHPGRVRKNNEDQFVIARLAKSMQIEASSMDDPGHPRYGEEDGYLLVVADGMGGAAAGERASTLAIESIESFALDTLKWFFHRGRAEEGALLGELRQAVERADRSVFREADADHKLAGMGTTLTLAYTVGADLYIAHVGDSRAYLSRGGELAQVTSDHTLVQMLVDQGVIRPEDAKHHARRNVVTNVIGGPQEGVQAEIHKLAIGEGDILLLCSDGLTEAVKDRDIAAVLSGAEPPEAMARSLVDLALKNGGPDNVTVIVGRYGTLPAA